MSRMHADVGVRYSIWNSIPSVYRDHADYARKQLDAQIEAALGQDLERLLLERADLETGQGFFELLVDSLDCTLAPAHASIEDLDLYLDPRLCPPDFLPWLSSWLGLSLNERWPILRRRDFVRRATGVFKLRGTVEGIRQAVELYTGIRPEVVDNGGTTTGQEPMGALPGSSTPSLIVTIPATDRAIDLDIVYDIVASVRPAHVRFEVRGGTK